MNRASMIINAMTALAAILAAGAAAFTGHATNRLSEVNSVWAAKELDSIDPVKKGLEALGIGKWNILFKFTDGSVLRSSEIIQIDYGGVYLRADESLLIIRYSVIASFAVDADAVVVKVRENKS